VLLLSCLARLPSTAASQRPGPGDEGRGGVTDAGMSQAAAGASPTGGPPQEVLPVNSPHALAVLLDASAAAFPAMTAGQLASTAGSMARLLTQYQCTGAGSGAPPQVYLRYHLSRWLTALEGVWEARSAQLARGTAHRKTRAVIVLQRWLARVD
jgi:hypothetical protein